MFFGREENELCARIEARIARLLDWPVENGEGLQVLHYLPGAEYKPHHDYFDPAKAGTPSIVARGGQRVGTVVMYLNAPENGGGTSFPDVALEVAPIKGNAVFFSYDRPHPITRTLHGGAPVIAGEKWVAASGCASGASNRRRGCQPLDSRVRCRLRAPLLGSIRSKPNEQAPDRPGRPGLRCCCASADCCAGHPG
jgi:hypothetical protein